MSKSSLGEAIAEFIGSMFIVIAAISPMILFASIFQSEKSIAVFVNAITVVFVICALIEVFKPVSGAHFNPIVTMVMLFEKKIGAIAALFFVFFQVAGGITGIILSHLMFYDYVGHLLSVSDITRNNYMYFGEILGSFILILAILLLIKAKSNKISIIIGLLVGGQIFSTSSMMFANPQVTIARMFTGSISGIRPIDGLVFIAMQIIGAILAYGVYRLIKFCKPDKEEKDALCKRMCMPEHNLPES